MKNGGYYESIITCVLVGHSFVNEAQTITQIFFANARFSFRFVNNGEEFGNALNAEGFTVVTRLSDGYSCTGELYENGAAIASHTIDARDTGDDNAAPKALKRTLMLALFHALKEATGIPTPWGALTGVRPAKQVRLWLESGLTADEIRERLRNIYRCRNDKIELAITVAQAERRLLAEKKGFGETAERRFSDDFNNPLEQTANAKKSFEAVSLYVGIPFCPSRCLYCSFITEIQSPKKAGNLHRRYLDALAMECKLLSNRIHENGQRIDAMYIGGGTPTVFSEELFCELLDIISRYFSELLTQDAEYTVEAGRPDTTSAEKLAAMRAHGVNRTAINPQTLNDATLRRIGRAHTESDFFTAYEAAQAAGFTNINVDIIAGLPGETEDDMRRTLDKLRLLSPAHITVHTLAVKRASRLNERLAEYPLSEAEAVDNMLVLAGETCNALGLRPYYMYRQKNTAGHFENTGYAQIGYECLYNVHMMSETQTVYGTGAGGVTKIVDGTKISRVFNPKNAEIYIERMMNMFKNKSERTPGGQFM